MLILAVVASVPDVGSVTPVVPVTVNVVANAPLIVSVLATLFAMPVPPLAAASVPATVIAPVVAEDGVSPVVPKVMDVTAAVEGTAPHDGAPLVVAIRTCPVVPAPVTPIAVVDEP